MNNTIFKSTLYIKKDVYFKRQVSFDNSKLYVGGIPDFDESVSFSNDSTVFFGKEANFKFNLNISNSDMYAAEGIYFKKPSIIENQSNIYIKGLANFDETIEIKGGSNVYFGSADFKKNFTLDSSNLYINNSIFKEPVDIETDLISISAMLRILKRILNFLTQLFISMEMQSLRIHLIYPTTQ